ncbi:MAG TPA: PilZ domain-containing protein [Pyrinomonadaceae bacterium]
MTTLIHQLVTRLRRAWANNRREAERYDAELEAQISARLLLSISLPNAQERPGADARARLLIGSTRNVSETGLAIVVPTLRVGSNLITEENCTLRIVLDIYPEGVVEMDAVVVHHRQFDEKDTEAGYLVGVSISEMSEDDRRHYLEYLATLAQRIPAADQERTGSARP